MSAAGIHGRTETRGDVRRTQVLGLHAPQRRDVARIVRVAFGRRLGDRQLGAHGTREIGVVGLPGFRGRIAEHRLAELGEGGLGIAVEQFGQMVDIDAAGLVEGDGERVGGGRDERRGRRGDHPLAEDRPHAGEAAFEVIILDAGDQPAIGIVGEGREVRPAMGFPLLAGLRVGRDRDDGVVDRPEAADEIAVGDAQPDLRVASRADRRPARAAPRARRRGSAAGRG